MSVTIHEMQFSVPMFCSMDAVYDSHPYALPGPPAGVQLTCSTFLRPDFPVYPESSATAQVQLVRPRGDTNSSRWTAEPRVCSATLTRLSPRYLSESRTSSGRLPVLRSSLGRRQSSGPRDPGARLHATRTHSPARAFYVATAARPISSLGQSWCLSWPG